ncbi:hypothetical protein C8J57DRAFT_1212384 [Mycena rebaudengoi]|nr:hypothetical protein C8J57DRAFT_1212384 [Mycena rebaudengoi]
MPVDSSFLFEIALAGAVCKFWYGNIYLRWGTIYGNQQQVNNTPMGLEEYSFSGGHSNLVHVIPQQSNSHAQFARSSLRCTAQKLRAQHSHGRSSLPFLEVHGGQKQEEGVTDVTSHHFTECRIAVFTRNADIRQQRRGKTARPIYGIKRGDATWVLAAVHSRCHSELRYNGTRIGLYLVVLSRTQIKLSRSQTEYGSLRVIRTIDTFKAARTQQQTPALDFDDSRVINFKLARKASASSLYIGWRRGSHIKKERVRTEDMAEKQTIRVLKALLEYASEFGHFEVNFPYYNYFSESRKRMLCTHVVNKHWVISPSSPLINFIRLAHLHHTAFEEKAQWPRRDAQTHPAIMIMYMVQDPEANHFDLRWRDYPTRPRALPSTKRAAPRNATPRQHSPAQWRWQPSASTCTISERRTPRETTVPPQQRVSAAASMRARSPTTYCPSLRVPAALGTNTTPRRAAPPHHNDAQGPRRTYLTPTRTAHTGPHTAGVMRSGLGCRRNYIPAHIHFARAEPNQHTTPHRSKHPHSQSPSGPQSTTKPHRTRLGANTHEEASCVGSAPPHQPHHITPLQLAPAPQSPAKPPRRGWAAFTEEPERGKPRRLRTTEHVPNPSS